MTPKIPIVLYKSVFENLPDGLAYCQMIFDPQGSPIDFLYILVNKNFEKLTGLKDALRTSNPQLLEIYGRVSLTGKPERFETYIKPLSIWLEISVFSPKKTFFVSMFQNITERKQMEKNLEDAKIAAHNVLSDLETEKEVLALAKVKDEAILSSIGDGLIVTDDKGNIIQVNEVFEKLLGWNAHEVIGKNMLDVVQKVDENGKIIPPEKRSLSLVLNSGLSAGRVSTISKNHCYIRKDKSKLPITGVVAPIIVNNKITGAVEVFRDVSVERRIDKAKTEFVSLASHQLRTPLTTINWYTEMLLTGDAGKVTPEQKKYLEQIYAGNHRMVELVNALLNVSRIELGTFAVEPKPVNIVKIAKICLEELKPKISEKKLVLEEKYGSGIPIIPADPQLLMIIFQNLLSNAVKYTTDKGKVEIKISLHLSSSILVKISDTGCGIPKNQQNKIFTKLFRADNAKKINAEGTGLGLYIVKSIMDHSGGKIWFESTENKGTAFYVTIPISGMKKKEGTKPLVL